VLVDLFALIFNMKKILQSVCIVLALVGLPLVASAQITVPQGGTGSTTLSGILFGVPGNLRVQTLKIGGCLLLSTGTLSFNCVVASSTLLGDANTFSGINKFTNASSNFSGTWQTHNAGDFLTSTAGDWAGTWQTHNAGDFLTSLAGAASSTLLRDTNTFSGPDYFTNLLAASTLTATTINGTYLSLGANSYADNIAIGLNALAGVSLSGNENVAVGTHAIELGTNAYQNVAVGKNALASSTASHLNVAIGYEAMKYNTTGSSNTAVGYHAMINNLTACCNVAVGNAALAQNTTGTGGTAVGYSAGYWNQIGQNNTALGYFALYNATSTSGSTAVGYMANYIESNYYGNAGSYNTTFGFKAGYDLTTGGTNIIIGPERTTGSGLTTGNNNIVIGDTLTLAPVTSASGRLNIGNAIFDTAIGSSSILAKGNVGINIAAPVVTLDVADSAATSTLRLGISGSNTKGGCILIKDMTGSGYTEIYAQGGSTYTKVAPSSSSC